MSAAAAAAAAAAAPAVAAPAAAPAAAAAAAASGTKKSHGRRPVQHFIPDEKYDDALNTAGDLLLQKFHELDKAGRGFLSRRVLVNALQEDRTLRRYIAETGRLNTEHYVFEAIDTDHDGVISPLEFLQMFHADSQLRALMNFFADADTNKDGKIDRAEFSAALRKDPRIAKLLKRLGLHSSFLFEQLDKQSAGSFTKEVLYGLLAEWAKKVSSAQASKALIEENKAADTESIANSAFHAAHHQDNHHIVLKHREGELKEGSVGSISVKFVDSLSYSGPAYESATFALKDKLEDVCKLAMEIFPPDSDDFFLIFHLIPIGWDGVANVDKQMTGQYHPSFADLAFANKGGVDVRKTLKELGLVFFRQFEFSFGYWRLGGSLRDGAAAEAGAADADADVPESSPAAAAAAAAAAEHKNN